MKFSFIFSTLLLTLTLLLAACGSTEGKKGTELNDGNAEENTSNESSEKGDNSSKKEDSTKSKDEANDSDNKVLTKPGETIKESEYTVELIKIKELNQTVDISPLSITVKDAKLIKYKDMTDSFKSEMEYYANGPLDDEFTYLQLSYTVENTEDRHIGWIGLTTVVTDQKEQIDVLMYDFLLDDTDTSSDFFGQVIKEAQVGLILKNPDVSTAKLIFESSYDSDSYEDITSGKTIDISFD